MNRYAFLGLVSAAVLSGCSSVSVDRDYDSTYDFSGLKTYAWLHETQPKTGIPRIDNDLNDRRIRAAIDQDLREKGFQSVEKAEADFLVTYYVNFKQRIEGSGSSVSFGMGVGSVGHAGGVGVSSSSTVSDYEEALLTIDFLNAADEELLWRGMGRRRTSTSSSPEKITARINEAVDRMLNKFPPKI